MFSKQIYQERRKVLKEKMGSGLLLFLGNRMMPMNFASNCFPFRQDSTFLYYFGVQEPRLTAVMDLDEDKEIIFGDELTVDDIIWTGQLETIRSRAEKVGVSDTRPFDDLKTYLEKAKQGGRTIHFLPPYQDVNKILLYNFLGIPVAKQQPSVDFINAVAYQRSRKQPEEIAEMEKAVNISNEMHLLAMRIARPGMKEFELVSAIQKLGADQEAGFSYPSIMTIHGEVLHNETHFNTLIEGKLLLNDSGAEVKTGYAGDLTRTFPVGKTFTSKQRDMYEVVVKAFEGAQTILKPGLNYKEVHRKAALIIAQGLADLGIYKGAAEDIVANNAHTLFFPHGVGHLIGLDVHDMESLGEKYVGYTEDDPKDTQTFGWKSLRLGRPLDAGFVVTIEPGVYAIPELIDQWEKNKTCADFINYDKVNEYRDFGGIRIEDNLLLTPEGHRRLGDGLIYKTDDIESYREEALS